MSQAAIPYLLVLFGGFHVRLWVSTFTIETKE